MASGGDTFNNRTLAVSFIGEEGMSNGITLSLSRMEAEQLSRAVVIAWQSKYDAEGDTSENRQEYHALKRAYHKMEKQLTPDKPYKPELLRA